MEFMHTKNLFAGSLLLFWVLIGVSVAAAGEIVRSRSPDFVPGKRFTEQAVYVLTSGSTFSAAEEFTVDLRNLERATVVGDTTGGGGHTVAGYTFDFEGFRVHIRIPYGRAYNPLNGEGWEGVGVIPHLPVAADQALDDVESLLNPLALASREIGVYAGQFGPRRVYLDDGGQVVAWATTLGNPTRSLAAGLTSCTLASMVRLSTPSKPCKPVQSSLNFRLPTASC